MGRREAAASTSDFPAQFPSNHPSGLAEILREARARARIHAVAPHKIAHVRNRCA